MKIRVLTLTLLSAALAFGQLQQEAPIQSASGGFNPVTLASEFFEHGNFVNYYAFANAVYDTFAPTLNNSGQSVNSGDFGFELGGGVSVAHSWKRSTLSLSYIGGYRHYSSAFYGGGTNQSLNLAFNRRMSRRWNLSTGVAAGTLLYGTGYFSAQAATNGNVQINPFSPNTRYASGYVSVAYQQSQRLSYVFTGGIYLQRYDFGGAIGTTGGNGDVAIVYRLTARTSISGDYNHSYFVYQAGAGSTNLDGYNFSISHRFADLWNVSAFGGLTHTNVNGFFFFPLGPVNGTNPVPVLRISYDTKATSPSFGGSVSRQMRRSQISAGGGQNVVSGNGFYLASKSRYLNGFYSRSYQRMNVGLGVYYSRLSTLTNTVGYSYDSSGFGASAGYQLIRHLSATARYDFLRYGTIGSITGVSDNRFSIGIALSSASIPLTLF